MPIGAISASTPYRKVVSGNHTYHLDPRISAMQLALYMVSPDGNRETIVKNAMKANTVSLVSYSPARHAVYRSYDGTGINPALLVAEAVAMESATYSEPFEERNCKELSAPALRKLAPITPSLDCQGIQVPRPQHAFAHLSIEGVRVSVQPEVVFHRVVRGAKKYGGVITHFSKEPSLARENDEYAAGEYAALLVFLMLSSNFGRAADGPRAETCFAVDVQHNASYVLPGSHRTMVRHLEAACRNIARQWNIRSTDFIETAGDDDDVF